MGSDHARKRQQGRHKSRAEKKRRGNIYGAVILGVPTLAFLFYLADRSGPLDTIQGSVVSTSSYVHSGRDAQGEHTHVSAVLEYEGYSYTLAPADRFQQGDTVSIEIHRGRLTGHPYFVQAWR